MLFFLGRTHEEEQPPLNLDVPSSIIRSLRIITIII